MLIPLSLALLIFGTIVLLIGRPVVRRYLDAYVARYGKLPPSIAWITKADADATVERLRQQASGLRVIGLVIYLVGFALFIFRR